MRFLKTGWPCFVLLLLCACGNSIAPVAKADARDQPITGGTGSACADAYAEAAKRMARNGPVIGPNMPLGKAGHLLLSFNTDADRDSAVERIAGWDDLGFIKGRSLFAYRFIPILLLDVESVTKSLLAALISRLRLHGLLSIYPDYELKLLLDNSRQFIGVDYARKLFTVDGSGVGVATIDSGLDELQGDFANVVENRKIVVSLVQGTDGDLFPAQYVDMKGQNSDSYGHGTHVAGVMAGTGAMSNARFEGVAPKANLIAMSTGPGPVVLSAHAVAAYDFLIDPAIQQKYNVRVVNNSYGARYGAGFEPFSPEEVAAKRAHDVGLIPVYAVGNEGSESDAGTGSKISAVATSPCVIGVANGYADTEYYVDNTGDNRSIVNRRGQLSPTSSRGKRLEIDPYDHPDITAPGVSIISAFSAPNATGCLPNLVNTSYCTMSGTSMASPHIAGLIALMLQVKPELTLDQILDIFSSTAVPMTRLDGSPTEMWEVGAGFVNADAALARARGRSSFLDSVYAEISQLKGVRSMAISTPAVTMPGETQVPFELPPGDYESIQISMDIGSQESMELEVRDAQSRTVGFSETGSDWVHVRVQQPTAGSYTFIIRSMNDEGGIFAAELAGFALKPR